MAIVLERGRTHTKREGIFFASKIRIVQSEKVSNLGPAKMAVVPKMLRQVMPS